MTDWTKPEAYIRLPMPTPLDKRMELERSRAKTQADDTKL